MKTLNLPYNITVRFDTDTKEGTVKSKQTPIDGTVSTDPFVVACDGLETLLLALACEGVNIDRKKVALAIDGAMEAIQTKYNGKI